MRGREHEQQSDAVTQRAHHTGIVERVYEPGNEGPLYQANVRVFDSGNSRIYKADIGVTSNGEIRSVREGDFVGLKFKSGGGKEGVIDAVYHTEEEPSDEVKEGDWSNHPGNSAVDIVGDKVLIGANGGRGILSSGLGFNTSDGSIFVADGAKTGIYGDGQGNFIWNYTTMNMPVVSGSGGNPTRSPEEGSFQKTISGDVAEGETKEYNFGGSISNVSSDGNIDVNVDGNKIDITKYQ